jgi:mycothiol S-conjugate amidase
MAVHAHPDDESSKGAATMARYAAEGEQVLVATLTGGEAGSILNPAMDRPEIRENITDVRREEMEKARQILGVEQRFMGFVDSGLPEGDPLPPLPEGSFALQPLDVAAEPLVRAIREFRPHVMTTYDESGGYPHPDHIYTHTVSMEAFRAAADPKRYPDSGEPWQVQKVYYNAGMRRRRFDLLEQAMIAHGLESPYAEFRKRFANSRPWPELVATTEVDCADYFDQRDQALLAHATQIDPNSFWFACPREIEREAWAHEDYHLVWSMVPVALPETDLFAGIRGTEAAT